MPASRATDSPIIGGSSALSKKDLVGDSLYEWARKTQEPGYVFTQQELLASNVIPNRDLQILLHAAQYLVGRRLFKLHDIKGQAGVGWELIEEAAAANYGGLTSDEQMVYSSIESSGTAGLWTKTIKAKTGGHAKVLERVYKTLEQKGLIKPMKSVKHPQRKMYILSHLQPSEEATGGTWFNEGRLDIGMINAVSEAIETYCCLQSWRMVEDAGDDQQTSSSKRKQPQSGFDEFGKGKARKTDDHGFTGTEIEVLSHRTKRPPRYEPFEPGYTKYPTLDEISKELRFKGITQLAIPNNALRQLLDVLVLDDRLFQMTREARGDEIPDLPDSNEIYMYRCFTSPVELGRQKNLQLRIDRGSKEAIRTREIEEIGRGGFGEVPCANCPVFDICGNGGPVNVKSCVYFDEWFKKLEEADVQSGKPWPGTSSI